MSEPYFAFTKNKQTDKYDVVGPVEFMKPGNRVTVTKADGTESEVTLGSTISSPFEFMHGKLKGMMVASGNIAPKPKKTGSPSGATKQCWECGCRFTYHDAKANDGDWNGSYCGC